MKAVRFHSYGGPETLRYEDAPQPALQADQALIRVHAAGVNPVDWKVREGYLKAALDLPMPVTPGGEVSGVVEALGPGVTGLKTGDVVFGGTGLLGGYAEYAAVNAAFLTAKPKSLDHIQAASVPLAAMTGWQALFDKGGLAAGQRVLIHAAAGGIGSFAVQFAHQRGAHVIGTASAANLGYVRELGADEVIDYRTTRFEEAVRDIDLVLDLIGGDTETRSWSVLKPGGILVSVVGEPSQEKAKAAGVRASSIYLAPNNVQLAEIAALIDAGHVRTHVSATFPLSEAAKAQELSKTGRTRGKIVLRIRD
jgi:NADPH:quinone reductase-like Zn-dependent oxidoreductase